MKASRAQENSALLLRKCVECGIKIRVAEWVIDQQMLTDAGSSGRFVAHVDCVRRVIQNVPDKISRVSVARAREELIALRKEMA